MPQMVGTSGQAEFSQTCTHDSQPVDNGTVCVVSDSGPFAVKSAAVWTLFDESTPAAARGAWFKDIAAALQRGMDATPMKDELTWSGRSKEGNLPTEILLEDTDALEGGRRNPSVPSRPSREGRCNPPVPSRCGSPLLLLTCALLMTSSHSEGPIFAS